MTVLKIQCIITHQWLKLRLPNFTRFTLIPYLQDHPLYKNLAAEFPAILDSFFYSVLIASGNFQHGWVAGAGGRQDGGFKFLKRMV